MELERGRAVMQERHVVEKLGLEPGSVVDERELSTRINRLFALGEFERAEFALRGDAARPTLDVFLREKSWGVPGKLWADVAVVQQTWHSLRYPQVPPASRMAAGMRHLRRPISGWSFGPCATRGLPSG